VLKRIFGPKRKEVTRNWRKIHKDEYRNVYTSPCIIRVIISRMIIWAGNVACMGRIRNYTKFRSEYLKRRDHLEDLVVDGRIKL
jgi:hypothetical protein